MANAVLPPLAANPSASLLLTSFSPIIAVPMGLMKLSMQQQYDLNFVSPGFYAVLFLHLIILISFLARDLRFNHKERKGMRILYFCLYFCIPMPCGGSPCGPQHKSLFPLTQLPLVSVSPQPPCFPLTFSHLLLPSLLVREEAPRADTDVAVQVRHPPPSSLVAVTARTTEASCSVTRPALLFPRSLLPSSSRTSASC